jgi:putative sigma-54 modulation protein
MRLELTGRHYRLTPATRALVERRVVRTLRLLKDRAVSAHVVLTSERAGIHVEVTLHARRERFLHGEATGSDLEVALGAAVAKIDQQARKLKGKLNGRKRRATAVVPPPAEMAPPAAARSGHAGPSPRRRIIRSSRYAVKPMSLEEAAIEMDDGEDTFIVFRNSGTDTITVLFRRPDGYLGLIEPDA